jgi:chromosome segregation ATPase
MIANFYNNHLALQLKEQHRNRIDFLQSKIANQQHEINQLNEQIKRMSQEKKYDC